MLHVLYHLQDPDIFLICKDFGNTTYEIVQFSSSHLQPLINLWYIQWWTLKDVTAVKHCA